MGRAGHPPDPLDPSSSDPFHPPPQISTPTIPSLSPDLDPSSVLAPRSATFPSSSPHRSSDIPRSEHPLPDPSSVRPDPPHPPSDPLLHPPPATLLAHKPSDLTFSASDLSAAGPDLAAAGPFSGHLSSGQALPLQSSHQPASSSLRSSCLPADPQPHLLHQPQYSSLTHLHPPLYPPIGPPSHRSPAPQQQQLSYAQVARGPRGPGFVRSHANEVEAFARLPRTGANIICGSREGLPSFSFTTSDLLKVEELYAKALVMKFHGGRPSLESSHKEISSWGMENKFSIGPLTSRAFLLRFQDEKDLLKVLTRPSTSLMNFPYKIFRWHNLCHLKEDSCIAPVWISLPKLPLQCFIPEFLESVGNKIGRFLCLDKATATLARPSVARLCVEIDLRKAPPQSIWVGLFDGFKQQILYDKLPKFCHGCHVQGHTNVECSKSSLDNQQIPTDSRPNFTKGSTPSVRGNAPSKPKPPNPLSHLPKHSHTHSSTITITTPPPESSNITIPAHPPEPNSHQQPTSTTTTPFPHIPSMPPNPPPSSSQALPTTLHPSPQAADLPPPIQTSATISSSTTPAPNIDLFQIQPTSTLVQHAPTAATTSFTPPDHSTLTPPSAAAPSPSDALLQVQPTAALLQRDSAAAATSAATSAAPSAGTQHQQTNIEVNKEIWEAVNRQVAILEQARLTDPAAAIKPSINNQFSTANSIKIKPSDVGNSTSLSKKQAAALEQFKGKVLEQSRVRDRHLSNHTSMNHFQALRDDNSEADDEAVSYYSDTDEGCVEPIEMGYQSANGRSSSKPSGLKTNKRHPNMPLHVRLRSRKSSYPSTP